MNEFFERDFYEPTVTFSVLSTAEREAADYRGGGGGWSTLGRAAATFAFAGVLFFGGPAVSSEAILRIKALRGLSAAESPDSILQPRRGKPLRSPVSDTVSAKAQRAQAFFEVLPSEAEPADPDYGF